MRDTEYYRVLGKQRASQDSFQAHNRARAPEGWAGYCAHFRAKQGLPLLDTWHIQYLRPEDLLRKGERQLTPEQQRMVYFSYVWQAVWGHIPQERRPNPPTQEQYEHASEWVRKRVGHGMPLENSLDVVFLTPNDLCDKNGRPYRQAEQKKRFRVLFASACTAALDTLSTSRVQGQRVPQSQTTPHFSARRGMPTEK